jgi:putative ABC transport system ATP-binding protein
VQPSASHIAIRSRDVKRHFRRGEYTVRAVDGITLDVHAGQLVGIVGTSGSGKTTYLNLVGGLDTPTDGHLEVMGQRLDALDDRGLALYRRTVIGIVFQSFHLLPAQSAFENVALPLALQNVPTRERRSLVETALERVSLIDRMDHLPSELSAGQQQRVAIARALVKQPQLLLADEPTGNLDSRTSQEILGLLQRLNHEQRLTVVLVSHDELAVGHIADRVVRIEDGRLATGEEP